MKQVYIIIITIFYILNTFGAVSYIDELTKKDVLCNKAAIITSTIDPTMFTQITNYFNQIKDNSKLDYKQTQDIINQLASKSICSFFKEIDIDVTSCDKIIEINKLLNNLDILKNMGELNFEAGHTSLASLWYLVSPYEYLAFMEQLNIKKHENNFIYFTYKIHNENIFFSIPLDPKNFKYDHKNLASDITKELCHYIDTYILKIIRNIIRESYINLSINATNLSSLRNHIKRNFLGTYLENHDNQIKTFLISDEESDSDEKIFSAQDIIALCKFLDKDKMFHNKIINLFFVYSYIRISSNTKDKLYLLFYSIDPIKNVIMNLKLNKKRVWKKSSQSSLSDVEESRFISLEEQ